MRNVVIADLSIVPIGTGDTSIGGHIAAAVNTIKSLDNVVTEITPMGTIIESPELSQVLKAVEMVHEALAVRGLTRVYSVLKIDDRRDKPRTMQLKVERILEELENVEADE